MLGPATAIQGGTERTDDDAQATTKDRTRDRALIAAVRVSFEPQAVMVPASFGSLFMLHIPNVRFLPEASEHDRAIEAIADEAFGPGRFVRAAERVREMAAHDRSLSFVAMLDGDVVGSVRQTPIRIGQSAALLLGPLAVRPAYKGKGHGKALMKLAEGGARAAGETVILLVGDASYYAPLGYRPVPPGRIRFPGPVDPRRVLGLELSDGALDRIEGWFRAR